MWILDWLAINTSATHAQALDSDLVDGCDCGRSFTIPLSILTRKVNWDILFGLIFKPLLVMTR